MSLNCIDNKRDYGTLDSIVSPLEISNCILWLDAQDESTVSLNNNNEVVKWNDKSPTDNHFSTISTSVRPKYLLSGGIGGSKSVKFFGGDKMRASTCFTLSNGVAFMALKAEDLGVNSIFLDDGRYSLRYEQWRNTGRMGYTHYRVRDYTSGIRTNYNNDDLAIFKKKSGTNYIEIQNNIAAGQQLYTGGDKPIPFCVLGGRNFHRNVDSFKGVIAEIVVYNRLLSNQEAALVQNYLKDRWGF